nr:S41 family peptidase [Natronospira proteinivora]
MLLAGLLLSACLDDLGDEFNDRQSRAFERAQDAFTCSTRGQNRQVQQVMADWYLYVEQMPSVDPDHLGSPQAVLDALQVNPPDRFSFLADRESRERFTEAGEQVGIGVQSILVAEPDDYRVVDVFKGSPAAEAGMARGDRLLEINGQSVASWFNQGRLGAAFGPEEEGLLVELTVERPDGSVYELALEKALFEVDPAPEPVLLELDDGQTAAYMLFRNFILPAEDRFEAIFSDLRDAEVDELILDMRYNGGGRLSVAENLASRIAGDEWAGETFVSLRHNEARSDQDFTRTLESGLTSLDLERLVVIATGRTASASELIINGLRPFIDVDVIGDRTFGKPVGSYGFGVCDLLLFPTAFSMLNAQEEGAYFDGLDTTCAASDGIEQPLGSPEEASLAQALHFVQTGQCEMETQYMARQRFSESHRPQIQGPEGWDPATMGIR